MEVVWYKRTLWTVQLHQKWGYSHNPICWATQYNFTGWKMRTKRRRLIKTNRSFKWKRGLAINKIVPKYAAKFMHLRHWTSLCIYAWFHLLSKWKTCMLIPNRSYCLPIADKIFNENVNIAVVKIFGKFIEKHPW